MNKRKRELAQLYTDHAKTQAQEKSLVQKAVTLAETIKNVDREYNQEMAQIEMANYIYNRTSQDLGYVPERKQNKIWT